MFFAGLFYKTKRDRKWCARVSVNWVSFLYLLSIVIVTQHPLNFFVLVFVVCRLKERRKEGRKFAVRSW